MTYRAPVRDLAHALKTVGFGRLRHLPAFAEVDDDTVEAVLAAGGELAGDILAPLNRAGDQVGARLENGGVRAAPGFKDAYARFVEGGWNGLAADPAFGGQGLPKALSLAVFETVHAANMAFGLCPMLTQGAIEALAAHGTERQQSLYLPRLVTGEWTGTMNLTEPQAGSDLGPVRTRAEPDGAGGYRLTGQKIFITWGDHDVADNIVHLVLARLPDAPAGSRGISLFLAPKRLVNEDGSLGEANALRCGSLEHKLGIHASPTCVMLFEGARAELVGTENQGLAHMFTMMNAARLQVGLEGVAIAERAFQQALAFAQERRQGRSAWTGEASAPIWDHPDVRRMLLTMKAKTEAGRAICLLTAVEADLGEHGGDAAALARYALLVPIAKAWCTDAGVEVASLGVQVHGGMGFIEETGAAQHYRDARIAPIYEGTNGIQALDLIGRKLTGDGGEAARSLLADIRATAAALDGDLSSVGARLTTAADAAERATAWLLEHGGSPDALAGATSYLKLMGDLVGGWLLARAAQGPADRSRTATARLFADHVLSAAEGLAAAATAGAGDLADLEPGALSA